MATDAHADAAACIEQNEQGQRLVQAGNLVESRTPFTQCAVPACPDLVREDCAERLQAVEQRLPALVFSARDSNGQPLTNAQVAVDGASVAESIDGAPVFVSPGQHTVRFLLPTGETREVSVEALEGAGQLPVIADFSVPLPPPPTRPTPAPSAPADEPEGPSMAPWIVGAVGLGGLVFFSALAAVGKYREDQLFEDCAPNCAEADVKKMRDAYAGADVSLVIGGACLVTAAIWLIADAASDDEPEESTPAEPKPVTARVAPGPADAQVGMGLAVSF